MSKWQVANHENAVRNTGSVTRCLLPIACRLLPVVYFLSACAASRSSFSATKKYSPEQLQKDYALYQNILETHHPSLYWYTSKDSMDHYFNWGKEQLKDSLTEPGFRKVLAYVISKVNCGHTSVRTS